MNQPLQQRFAQAQALLQQGRIDDCLTACKQLLAAVPGEPNLLQLAALANLRAGRADAAESAFKAALTAAPKRPDLLLNYGAFLREQGRIGEAERRLRKATKVAPQLAPAWHKLGLLLLADGQLPEARRCAEKMTSLETANPAAWELLAAVTQKQGDLAGALQACRRGLAKAPNAPRLHYSLAQLQRENCDFLEAAQSYERAQELGFDHPDLYRNRAEALLDGGESPAALTCAAQGVERFPDHATLQRTTARLHFELGADGDPLSRLYHAARSAPGNADLWQTLVELLKRLKREEESSEALAEARRLGCPDTPGILGLEAQNAALAGDPLEASRRFDALLTRFPGDDSGRLNFATHLIVNGDPQRGEALCGEILQRNPYDQLALCYRGTAWQMLGDPREHWLMDYERMVVPVPVPVPEGYGSREEFFADMQAVLERLHQTSAHPIEQSVRGGTQTNGFLFRLKDVMLATLERQIRSAICQGLETFPDDPKHPFWGRRARNVAGDGLRFSGAWSVRLRDQGFHTNHIHPEGWVSSALYIALPDEVRDSRDESGYIQFGSPLEELGLNLAPQRTVAPEIGTLVLFPSYMWHGTIPFHSEQPRITVAFDLQPQG